MALTGVITGVQQPPRIVLYASPGVGKTTFGSNAPNPIFVTTEDGARGIKGLKSLKSTTWEGFLAQVRQVAEENHDHETLVIDTLNGATDLCNKHICDTIFGGSWATEEGGFLSYGRGYGASAEELRRLLILIDKCRDRGMTVLMLAHTGLINVKHPMQEDFQRFGPAMQKDLWAVFSRHCDIIMRADYEYAVSAKKGKRNKASTGRTRILYCAGSAAEEGKTRCGFELPERMELSYDVFASHLGKADDTIEEVRTLMVELLTKEEQTAALKFLGADKLDDAPLQKLKLLLNRLLEKQSENESETE